MYFSGQGYAIVISKFTLMKEQVSEMEVFFYIITISCFISGLIFLPFSSSLSMFIFLNSSMCRAHAANSLRDIKQSRIFASVSSVSVMCIDAQVI